MAVISLNRVSQKVDGLLKREDILLEKVKKLEDAEARRKRKKSSYSKGKKTKDKKSS